VLKILGYPDSYSVPQGGQIKFMISLEEDRSFSANLVKVIHGDCNPEGPGLKFVDVPNDANGTYEGRRQQIDAGSYMVSRRVPPLKGFAFTAWIWPTIPDRGFQVIAAQGNWKIGIDQGALTLRIGADAYAIEAHMLRRQWYSI
jgi:N,N-dimethylformamidase